MAITLFKKVKKAKLYPGDKPGAQDIEILGGLALAQRFPGVRSVSYTHLRAHET